MQRQTATVAAGPSPEFRNRGSKTKRGRHIFNTTLGLCSNQWLNMKWGAHILNGGPGITALPAGDSSGPQLSLGHKFTPPKVRAKQQNTNDAPQ